MNSAESQLEHYRELRRRKFEEMRLKKALAAS